MVFYFGFSTAYAPTATHSGTQTHSLCVGSFQPPSVDAVFIVVHAECKACMHTRERASPTKDPYTRDRADRRLVKETRTTAKAAMLCPALNRHSILSSLLFLRPASKIER